MREEANNRDFFRLLHIHYPLIREMCVSACRFTGRDDAVSFISDFYSRENQGVQPGKLFETMRDCGMLIKNNALWGVPSYITLFIRKREGRSHYTSQYLIRACLQDIRTRVFSLKEKCGSREIVSADIAEDIFALEDTYQQLAGASQNNCHKISQEVSAFQLGVSLDVSSSKIDRFLRLYNDFIMPMLAIVVDPDNELENVSQETLDICNKLLKHYGDIENLGYHIRGLIRSIRIIQGLVAEKILQAKNELDALVAVYREHRRIVQGINYFWEVVLDEKEDEKERIFDRYFRTSGRFRYHNPATVAYETHILNRLYKAEATKSAPKLFSLESGSLGSSEPVNGMVSFAEICVEILNKRELPCILSWLCECYHDETATFLIEKLFDLEKRFPDYIHMSDRLKTFELNSISVKLKVREWHNAGK